MTTNKDTDLREALRRKYTNTPQLPSGFLNRMQQATQTKKHRASTLQTNPHSRRRTGWGWVGIAAAILIAILLWPGSHRETMTQTQVKPVVAMAKPQPVPQPVAEEKTENAMAEVQLAPQPARQPARKRRKAAQGSDDDIQSAPVEEPVPAQAEPMGLQEEKVPDIPADKQALADFFFAEEALQVAYELSAQQEELRAYAASLTGQELPKTVIAF